MNLTERSLKSPIGVAVGVGLIIVLGLVALIRLPVQLFPDIDEPVLPDQPLSSVAAFARFLCALRVAGDPLALLRSHEISPEAWSACAQAWSQLLAGRPDLALRLSQLCAVPEPSGG